MQNGELSEAFLQFVEFVKESRTELGRELNVLDLRLECRDQRLTEFSDWSARDLDLIEQQVACYDNEAPLAQVVSANPPTASQDGSWLHSPSPFAWT